jgi:hypothetical protein
VTTRPSPTAAIGQWKKCEREGCDEVFLVKPRNARQKYHDRSCGDAVRKRWLQPSRQRYMREYMAGYIRLAEPAESDAPEAEARKSA